MVSDLGRTVGKGDLGRARQRFQQPVIGLRVRAAPTPQCIHMHGRDIEGQIAQLQSLTKLIVPNSSCCPGWGEVTVKPATTTAST